MKCTATFTDKSADVFLTISKADGSQVQKTVPFEKFVDVLKKEDEIRGRKISRMGKLPHGFIDGGVDGEDMEVLIHVPKGIRPLEYFGTTYVIPWPDLVFYLHSSKGKVTKSCLFCVDEVPNEKTKLLYYPFGNVHSDGRICWGQNVLPKVRCLCDYDKVVSLFFSADTNDDLYETFKLEQGRKKKELTQRELLETLKSMKEFPVKCLRDTGRTFGQL